MGQLDSEVSPIQIVPSGGTSEIATYIKVMDLFAHAAVLGYSSSGGSGGSPMEERVAILETKVDRIQEDVTEIKGDVKEIRYDMKADFRILAGMIIFLALGAASLMAHGFKWITW